MWLPKKFNLFAVVLIAFASCSQPQEVTVVKDTFEDGKPRIEMVYLLSGNDSVPVAQTEYHDNGAIKLTGKLDSLGQRHGEWNAFYADSSKWSNGYYEHGLAEGKRKVWFPNGQLRIEGTYENGKEVGLWTYRNEQGKVLRIEDFDQR